MNIGFDAKRAIQNNTGLGNYSRYLAGILSKHYPENHYTLFAPRRKHNAGLDAVIDRANTTLIFPRGLCSIFAPLWRMIGVKKDIRENNIDLYHGLSNELPWGMGRSGTKTVVTIHDLIFMRYPGYYKAADRCIYCLKAGYACRTADRIVAVSECTKRDIMSFFHVPEQRIVVIYQGCRSSFAQSAGEDKKKDVAARYSLPRRFLLSVGTIEERKNLMLTVRALERLPGDIHLVAVGRSTRYQEEVERYAAGHALTSRLHILNRVAADDLPAIYQLADLFIYPSFFEGFGIPIIEALSSGLPVIAARGSCLEEAGGPQSVYIDPYDARALSEAITTLLDNREQCRRMAGAGREYVKRFSDARIASDIIGLYNEVIGPQARSAYVR
ncbi:MAG: glycosyltransferase family 4 protein [Tannerellaceae bacterium]|jgi:glycosyltransferase involved in cell wall biosynthesis|nr:glycosyltransferase family 4 protein [Tannerellaceae bacterium]